MTRCLGTIISGGQRSICHHTLLKCKNCGNSGCNRQKISQCTKQGFFNNKCLKCGTKDQNEIV